MTVKYSKPKAWIANPEPLEKVAEWLEAGAPHHVVGVPIPFRGYDLGVGIETTLKAEVAALSEEEVEKALQNPDCGAMCCIAGAVVQFTSPLTTAKVAETLGYEGLRHGKLVFETPWWGANGVYHLAIDVLGISRENADQLFTPSFFEDDDDTRRTDKALAARVIRHFIATGVVDWNEGDGEDHEEDYEVVDDEDDEE